MQKKISLRTKKFLSAVTSDNLPSKFKKYKDFIKHHKNDALQIVDSMLDLAIKHNFIAYYEEIHNLIGKKFQRKGKYDQVKEESVKITNKKQTQSANYKNLGNIESQVKTYLKTAEIFMDYGYHKDAAEQFQKLFRVQNDVVKRDAYFSLWARELLLVEDFSKLGIFLTMNLEQKKKDVTLAIIKDLKLITMGKKKTFDNLLSTDYTMNEIMSNKALSLQDLGFIYSLHALAYQNKEFLRKDVRWSSKVQTYYLQNHYKTLFAEIEKYYDTFGGFNSIVRSIYEECYQQIKWRVLREIFDAYHMASFVKLKEMANFEEGIVRIYLKDNPHLPYLIDPITQSVVYSEKQCPLYQEIKRYHEIIKSEFIKRQKASVDQGRIGDLGLDDFDDDEFEDRRMKGGRHRMGGMRRHMM